MNEYIILSDYHHKVLKLQLTLLAGSKRKQRNKQVSSTA
jgi:hypothetical protein